MSNGAHEVKRKYQKMVISALKKHPKVSVLMLTYNHAQYIQKAIDSVLEQVTDFPLELVISDDCSTDETTAIITEYQRKYPNLIEVLYNRTNTGVLSNFAKAWSACRGAYIALLDGDDYWVCKRKLQLQADYLDTHDDCTLTFGRLDAFDNNRTYAKAG